MPAQLNRADRRLLAAAAGILVTTIVITLVLTASTADTSEFPSSYSVASSGAKAAYLLLEARGYHVERWARPPAELDAPDTTTLVIADPIEAPAVNDREAVRQFVEHGGRLIVTGAAGSLFVSTGPVPDPVGGLTWRRVEAASPSPITAAAPSISLQAAVRWSEETRAIPLYGPPEMPVVVQLPLGQGQAFWWAAATPLTNAGLREPGNLEFFLASVGPANGRRVLFDEYFHGARASLVASVGQTPIKWAVAQAIVFAAAILLTYSRRSGPLVQPARDVRLSPIEFVTTLGTLYSRARAASIAVDIASRRFRVRLARRLGTSTRAPIPALARAAEARWAVDGRELAETLEACERAEHSPTLDAREALALVRSLHRHSTSLDTVGAPARAATSIPPTRQETR